MMANSGDPRVFPAVGLSTYVAVGGSPNSLGRVRSVVGRVPDLVGTVGARGGLGTVGQAAFGAHQGSAVAYLVGIRPTTTFVADKVLVPTNGGRRPNGKLPTGLAMDAKAMFAVARKLQRGIPRGNGHFCVHGWKDRQWCRTRFILFGSFGARLLCVNP